ncbi:MAG: AAA family ATPase [Candidatus Competibacteraceae bacterium]|nr:AAA family ATPase [Candidatus Competibacteraceae bacterium]
MTLQRIYTGRGGRAPAKLKDLPSINPEALRAPEGYLAPPDLAAAVDVALTLGMPLLLTGEPGSGKSALADSVAHELGLGQALRFVVKSDTEARDLFYRFDTVGRFHAAQTPGADAHPGRYISFAALGKAILHAKPPSFVEELGVPARAVDHPGERTRSVVLIDEIDKAPRDVPNDILVEIETMRFDIPELSGGGRAVRIGLDDARNENQYRPIVIFTSNREKALPEPFLRRCAFYHLEFPPFKAAEGDPEAVTVTGIVGARLGGRYERDRSRDAERRKNLAIDFFRFLRADRRGLERRPTLAELLDWLDFLMPQAVAPDQWEELAALEKPGSEAERWLLTSIETLLLKKPTDQRRDDRRGAAVLLDEWRRERGSGGGR